MNKKLFPLFILFSALGLTSVAAYFSIVGISSLFSGAVISVSILALFLEIGKICSVSFAYRYWSNCTLFLKGYLICAILTLMVITSFGIFGYLSAAFQKSSIEFGVTQDKIVNLQDQKKYYQDKIDASKKRIDDLTTLRTSEESRMSQVLTNEYVARSPVQLRQIQQQNVDLIGDTDTSIKSENTKIQEDIDGIDKVNSQINDLKIGTSNKKDVQTFKFVADALNLPLSTVARWFILAIICVFDPLAVCLILAYNVSLYKKDDEIQQSNIPLPTPIITPKIEEIVNQPINPVVTDEPKIVLPVTQVEKVKEITPPTNPKSDFFKQMFKL